MCACLILSLVHFSKVKFFIYKGFFSDANGFPVTEIFVSQSYLPRIYRFDWESERGELLYAGKEPVETIDALFWDGTKLLYTHPGEIAAYNPATKSSDFVPPNTQHGKTLFLP